MDELRTVDWRAGCVCLIDQTLLPETLTIRTYSDWREVAQAIRTMIVRGAPAIGCAAGLGLALGARSLIAGRRDDFLHRLEAIAQTFRQARPTAVNLSWAIDRLMRTAQATPGNAADIKKALLCEALAMLEEDVVTNRAMGQHGAAILPDAGGVLTHCNAGALATVAYGTALGVIRAGVSAGKRLHVYADETRPRLQGMRLTAWELLRDGIPVTVIADNMAAALMQQGKVACVVVGADRIAANGDTANKIGTYALAIVARHHDIPFYVAAPFSTIDARLRDGSLIPIEERDSSEITHIQGVRIAPEGVEVWNPSFDVTPGALITGFITERGILQPPFVPQEFTVAPASGVAGSFDPENALQNAARNTDDVPVLAVAAAG